MEDDTHSLTSEQRLIVNSHAHIIVVQAYAGTGKTTTLQAYARARPRQNFTYICYNKAIQLEANARFPSNVHCVTFDALAYRRYAKDKTTSTPILIHPLNIAFVKQNLAGKALRDRRGGPVNLDDTTMLGVAMTLKNFAEDTKHGHVHLYHTPTAKLSEQQRYFACQLAQWLWQQYQKRSTRLACYTLNRAVLWLEGLCRDLPEHTTLLIDEAQDLNALMLSALTRTPHPKIFVGDQHQRIYGMLLGSKSALDNTSALVSKTTPERYHLTQSFRYGHDVAALLTRFVRLMSSCNKEPRIRGTSARSTHVPRKLIEMPTPFTALFRTNCGMVIKAASYAQNPRRKRKLRLFVRGWKALRANILRMKRYGGGGDAKKSEGLMGCKKIMQHFGENLTSTLVQLDACLVSDESDADIVLSTIHQMKGLESDRVWVHGDINLKTSFQCDGVDGVVTWTPRETEEMNLVY